MANIVLEARNIKREFGTTVKTEILHGINFSLTEGEFVSLIGYSGSGKSTLLNILGALDQPTSGGIFLEDKNMEK